MAPGAAGSAESPTVDENKVRYFHKERGIAANGKGGAQVANKDHVLLT